eukprot:1158385-Pelagomonas_calceolata.AAC.8
MWGNFSSIAKNLTEQLTEQAGIDVSSLVSGLQGSTETPSMPCSDLRPSNAPFIRMYMKNQARENLTGQIRGIADSVLHEHQHKQQSNAEKQCMLARLLCMDAPFSKPVSKVVYIGSFESQHWQGSYKLRKLWLLQINLICISVGKRPQWKLNGLACCANFKFFSNLCSCSSTACSPQTDKSARLRAARAASKTEALMKCP